MPREGRATASPRDCALAALLVSLLLLAGSLPTPFLRPVPCDWPAERLAEGGVTTHVSCGSAAGPARPLRGPARLLFGGRIDLNRASASTLEVLPGIGPRRAAAIVEARGQRRFERVGDLQRVVGIGPRTVEGLSGWVEVEPERRLAD